VRLSRIGFGRRREKRSPVAAGEGNKGYFVKPTVLVNTTEKMKVVREEIFGPVVTAIPFATWTT